MSGEIAIVTSWDEFREKWTGGEKRQNFLLRGEMFPYQYDSPALEAIVDEVRQDEALRSQWGCDDKKLKPQPYPGFTDMPTQQAVGARILLAHFESRNFAGPGKVFEGVEEIFDAWYRSLKEHGFSWNERDSQRAFFWSGPDCHSGYHFDSSYVLAWQVYGRKRFCWLKEPERWCPSEVRREDADRYDRMACPEGITADDIIECEMEPGDVLWNVMLTPHWVYSLDEPSYSFNLTHWDFRCDGELSSTEKELAQIRRERETQHESESTQLASDPS